jgi:mannosyl-glycoprotein endo-beta-N-acetylglucosaminidase
MHMTPLIHHLLPKPRMAPVAAGTLLGMVSALVAVPATADAAGARQAGTVVATVRTDGGSLRVRRGPAVYSDVAGSLADGARVTLSCGVRGQLIAGTVQATRQWNRLPDGRYVSDAYTVHAPIPACPEPAGPAPSMTQAQFVAAAVPLAQRGRQEFDVPASVTIAQAILESGWGASALSANDRNYFGIKCFGWPGSIAVACHNYATTECDPTGACHPAQAPFRAYASVADSFRDHGLFLRANDRYQTAFTYSHDADRFLYEIWKAGYATSPTYVQNVSGLMKQYDLYRYDS